MELGCNFFLMLKKDTLNLQLPLEKEIFYWFKKKDDAL